MGHIGTPGGAVPHEDLDGSVTLRIPDTTAPTVSVATPGDRVGSNATVSRTEGRRRADDDTVTLTLAGPGGNVVRELPRRPWHGRMEHLVHGPRGRFLHRDRDPGRPRRQPRQRDQDLHGRHVAPVLTQDTGPGTTSPGGGTTTTGGQPGGTALGTPKVRASATRWRGRGRVMVIVKGRIDPPAGTACGGRVRITVKARGKTVRTRTATVRPGCN